MKVDIIIVCQCANQVVVKSVNVIPRVGDNIDMFYFPVPVVTKVVLYPRAATMKTVDPNGEIMKGMENNYPEAIVFID